MEAEIETTNASFDATENPVLAEQEPPNIEEVRQEGINIAVSGDAAVEASEDLAGEEEEGIELGDRIGLTGGRYDNTRGRIYYIDDELIRILPDGLSDRLIDLAIVDGEIDPALRLESIIILKKRAVPSFVEIFDLRVGQIAETFTSSGEPGQVFKINEVNKDSDRVVLEDETGATEEIEFAFRGIPREIEFAVIRSQDPPKEVEAEPEAEGEVEAVEEPEIEFEFLDEVEVPVFEEVAEIPSAKRVYSDLTQKDDMLQDLIKTLDPAQQKNMRRIIVLRRLVENMAQLRNDLVKYDNSGRASLKQVSFETLAELLENSEFPLAKQVLAVAKSLYLDHSDNDILARKEGRGGSDPTDNSDPAIQLNYLEDVIQKGINYYESQTKRAATEDIGIAPELKVPQLHTAWEGFVQNYFKVIPSNTEGAKHTTSKDKDFFRAEIPIVKEKGENEESEESEEILSGLGKLDSGSNIIVNTDYIGKVPYSYLRTIGPRKARYGDKVQARIVEQGDESEILSYVLFPLLFARDLGVTRSGQFALDVANSQKEPMTMDMILHTGGEITDIPSTNSIIAVRPDGSSLGNVEIADWLKGQAIYGGGIADLAPYLRSFGLDEKELTVEQKKVLTRKVALYQANVKKFLSELRSRVSKEETQEAPIVNHSLLNNESEAALFSTAENEKLLLDALADFASRFPSYSKNDIARFASLYVQFQDLTLSVLGGSPEGIAIERRRAVRDQFLKSLRDALTLQIKSTMAGQPPTPNTCVHVATLDDIRKIKDDGDRMKIMIKFLNEFRGEKKDHWINCSVCKKHLICEHEFLLLQEYLHPREKDVIHKQLLLTFSDGDFNGKFICGNCGQPISDLEFDTNLEYDDNGNPMMGRAVLIDEDALADEEYAKVLAVESEETVKIDFGDEDQTLIYRTINQIASLMGIFPDRASYTKMVNRVQTSLAKYPDRQTYSLIQRREEQARKKRGEALGEKIDYDIFINRNMVSLSAAALLIDVQTHMPNYVIRYTLQGCAKPEFYGFPMDAETDMTGIEYISCAVASIMRRENPWDLTGFQAISSDANRQKRISLFVLKATKELANTAEVQQDIATKRQYLQETFGAEAASGRPTDKIPDGFTPEQIVLTKAQIEGAEQPIIEAAATPRQRARAWILEGHRLARLYGKYLPSNPFSEASCCYSPLMAPGDFWRTQTVLPDLGYKSPPRGPRGSVLFVHMIPRPLDILFGKPDASIMYRLFMRVCFRGPRKGLQHEPGYNRKCPWCGLQFPEDPRLPPPQPVYAKDGATQKKYDEEYASAITEREQLQVSALANQGVEITKDSFEDLLSESNRRFIIEPLALPQIPSSMDNMRGLLTLNPAPFDGYAGLMNATIEQLASLNSGADRVQIALAFSLLSEKSQEFEKMLQERLGSDKYNSLNELMRSSPRSLGESLRTYFLIPFQRAITQTSISGLTVVQKRYELSTETQGDIKKFLTAHLEVIPKMSSALDKSPFGKAKVREAIAKLSVVIPVLVKILRANIMPGGSLGLEFIQRAIISGIFSEFIDPNHVPAIDEGEAEPPVRAVSAKANLPIQILGILLNQLKGEGLNFTAEHIKTKIADRNEKEKNKVIKEFDVLDKEGKRLELMNKKLGLGRWAVGGTKVIWQYDEDQYLRDKIERQTAGISDDPRYQFDMADFGPEGEGGYEVEQTAPDDA